MSRKSSGMFWDIYYFYLLAVSIIIVNLKMIFRKLGLSQCLIHDPVRSDFLIFWVNEPITEYLICYFKFNVLRSFLFKQFWDQKSRIPDLAKTTKTSDSNPKNRPKNPSNKIFKDTKKLPYSIRWVPTVGALSIIKNDPFSVRSIWTFYFNFRIS